jgi:predicted ester cyclase
MDIADLIAGSQKVAAHFRWSGTHLKKRMGYPPTGRRFQDVDRRDRQVVEQLGVGRPWISSSAR